MTSAMSGERIQSESVKEARDLEEGDSFSKKQRGGCSACWGFFWKDWTQVVGRVGVSAGIVTSGVGVYLISPYVVAGGVACVVISYFFPDLRVSCVKPEKDFEDNVDRFGKDSEELGERVLTLQNEVQELTEVKVELEQTLKEANQSVTELKDSLEEKEKDLDKTASQLFVTAKKLEIIQKLYIQLKKATTDLAKQLHHFNSVNQVFKDKLTAFSKELEAMDSEEKKLFKEVGEAENFDDLFEKQNHDLGVLMGSLKENIGSLTFRFKEIKEALVELGNETKIVSKADEKYRESAETIKNLLPRLENILTSFKDLFEESEEDSSLKKDGQKQIPPLVLEEIDDEVRS